MDVWMGATVTTPSSTNSLTMFNFIPRKGRRATTLMEYLRTKLNDTEKHGFTTDFATGGKNWEWRAAKTLAEGLLIPAAADGLARPFKMETWKPK